MHACLLFPVKQQLLILTATNTIFLFNPLSSPANVRKGLLMCLRTLKWLEEGQRLLTRQSRRRREANEKGGVG